MFAFGSTVLLVGVRTRHMMGNAISLKVFVETLVLATPIILHTQYFVIKKAFNMCLKTNENFLNFRFCMQEINPSKLAKCINKLNIILVTTNR
jgi:hypothetical protein